MPYQCRHCGGTYCSEHRLPESHDCPGLENWDDPDGVFDSGFDDSVDNRGRTASGRGASGGLRSRLAATGGPLSYFRGNATYLFLAVMLLTFVAEQIVLRLYGPEAFRSIFVLSAEHPFYVWTWVTSVFAHDPTGFFHLFGNGIALFFFGPIVERRVGTRAYVALFLASGMLAGLGQIGLGFLLGNPVTAGVLGASGAVMAILAVLTVLNPDLRVLLYFFIPVPIWVLTFGYAALSLLGTFSNFSILGGNIAHIAHLTGLVIGLAYGEYVRRQGVSAPGQLQFGGGGGGGRGGMGGPGRGR